jgi:excisionase family DNA binding protein
VSNDEVLQYVKEDIERALCKRRKLEQIESVTATVEEAAEILGISRGSAYAGVRDGTIPSISINGRILIPILSLARMLVEANERPQAAGDDEDAA